MDKVQDRLLITGATGYIGSRLIAHLRAVLRPEVDITALVHNTASFPEDDHFHVIKGDITALGEDVFCAERFDYAIHCAALMADSDRLPKSAFEQVNVEGTRKIIHALKGRGLKQFIHLSTVGVYGPTNTEPVVEESGYGILLSDYEWSKMESEKVVSELCTSLGVPFTILRVGLLYGAGMRYGWPQVMSSIDRGTMRIIGDGSALIQLSYIDDVIEMITRAIGNRGACGATINICGTDCRSISDVFSLLSQAMDRPAPGKIPFSPVYLISQLLDLIPDTLKPQRLRLLTPHRVRFFREPHVYSTAKAMKILKFVPRYGIGAGMAKMAGAREKN